jgi:hypothetical protein
MNYPYSVNRSHSNEQATSSPGLRRIVLVMVVTVPWTHQRWALNPVMNDVPEGHLLAKRTRKQQSMAAHSFAMLDILSYSRYDVFAK